MVGNAINGKVNIKKLMIGSDELKIFFEEGLAIGSAIDLAGVGLILVRQA